MSIKNYMYSSDEQKKKKATLLNIQETLKRQTYATRIFMLELLQIEFHSCNDVAAWSVV